jgi:hypothetical protein
MLPITCSQPACRNMLVKIDSVAIENQLPLPKASLIRAGTAPHWRKKSSRAASPPLNVRLSSKAKTAKQARISATVTIGKRRVGFRS